MEKNLLILFLTITLLLTAAGCGKTKAPEVLDAPPEPAVLYEDGLKSLLADLSADGAMLRVYREGEWSSCRADSAIRAERYIETLRGFTWESHDLPEGWDWVNDDGYRCAFEGNGVSLTAYQSCVGDFYPFHAVTESGEGWFFLPYIEDTQDTDGQVGWMPYNTLSNWWGEAQTAECYRGSGTPLSADELDRLEAFTGAVHPYNDGPSLGDAGAINCFFTSLYDDPRDMDAGAFLQYFPSEKTLSSEDEAEFALVQKKLNWRSGADDHLFLVGELPVPCHRIPRAMLDDALTKYAGITVAEMHTDWTKEYGYYIPETDCFYTFTSDFGPGMFVPYYGEKDGNTVSLWTAGYLPGNPARRLTLQKSGEDWRILSHQTAD